MNSIQRRFNGTDKYPWGRRSRRSNYNSVIEAYRGLPEILAEVIHNCYIYATEKADTSTGKTWESPRREPEDRERPTSPKK